MAHYSKNELIEIVQNSTSFDNDAKSQLIYALRQDKKYGLIWEDSTEESLEIMRQSIPFMEERTDLAICPGNEKNINHILIEGDNLNAITSLCYTHEGAVDVIYIDPPKSFIQRESKYSIAC